MSLQDRSVALRHALEGAEEIYRRNHPASEARHQAAQAVMPGGNTRSSLWTSPFPITMASGEGSQLTDLDGNVYRDFLGEFTAGIFGHSPAVLKRAIINAMDDGINLSSHNQLETLLAERLCARFPSFEMVRFCNSGTEANLMAVNAALAFSGRTKIIVFEGAYHGAFLTFGKGVRSINAPLDFVVLPYNNEAALEKAMLDHGDNLAAILIEPMLGAGGCIPGTESFLRATRAAADRVGAALIFDEVQTSRLHYGGRQQQLNIIPDLTVIGKFFGGGLAFGCFGGRRAIMEQFDPRGERALPHAGTFNNNTLTMAAGIAAIDHLLTAESLDQLNLRGERLRGRLDSMFLAAGAPLAITGLGSLMNIHSTRPTDGDLRKLLYFDLLEAKVFTATRGLIALSFALDDEDMQALERAVSRWLDFRGDLWA